MRRIDNNIENLHFYDSKSLLFNLRAAINLISLVLYES